MALENDRSMSVAEETTPLLPQDQTKARAATTSQPILYLLLLSSFLISLSFGITQVPILYVFRIMTCEAYYEQRTPDPDAIDRCDKHEIEAGASRAFALLSASTSIFGLINLLVAGWSIKRLGTKRALIIQIIWPAVRNFTQVIGIIKGSNMGMLIVQLSQVITVIGGPNGYVLCLNSFVADVVTHEARTGALGKLQGCMFIGAATGFLIGGVFGDAFGIIAPFRMAFVSFLLCCVFIALALPATTPPEKKEVEPSRQALGVSRFFGPLRIFTPQEWVLPDGRTTTQFGALTLGIGVFLSILATGYIVILLQQYATAQFHFGTKDNGYLIFMYMSLRGAFLSLVFPRIIARGRKWLQPPFPTQHFAKFQEEEPLISGTPFGANEIEVVDPLENEDPLDPTPQDEQETFAFDLFYARISVLLDALVTGASTFITKPYQLYIVALLLPFTAGTGAASKGAILQMLPNSDRVDALSGITLVENVARLSTTTVFGLAFSVFAQMGRTRLIFVCNAGIALLGFAVLCLARFPSKGSRRVAN